ncbi:porin [Thioalkalivibrio sulfidiphilus]|uniref:porin n=1 Tax=Thioalkalivibrio sulfidiphilus TaxID=1033854 RepID=UPI00059E1DDC|nr:porin [Thioalkalivibrio sulfidiphilus]
MNKFACSALVMAMAAAGIMSPSAASAAQDKYTSFPMAYGRESAASEDLTMIMGLEMQPAFTHLDRNGAAPNDVDKSEFSFQRLRWFMRGSVTEDVDYLFVTEWARNAATNSSDGGARAFRARATFRDVADTTNVAVGSIIVPFGHAFYVPAGTAPWVNYTRMTSTLYGCGSIGCTPDQGEVITNIWKTGVMVFDQISFSEDSSLTYTAGVYNSSGTRFQDDGTQKDFNGSLEYHNGNVFAHYGLRLGSQQVVGDEMDRERHAIVLRYNNYLTAPWWLWGEYMWGKDEVAGADDVKAEGFELSAGYKFTPKWEGVIRYSEFDPNKDVNNNKFQEISLGLTYRMQRGIRWQFQVDFNENESKTIEDTVYTARLTVPLAKKLM